MPKSARLRSSDVRAIYELAGECRDLGDSAPGWWWHYFDRLAALAGGDWIIGGEMAGCRALVPRGLGQVNWAAGDGAVDPAVLARQLAEFRTDPGYAPSMIECFRHLRGGDAVCLSRAEFVADRDWYASPDYQVIQRAHGMDAVLWSFRAVPGAAGDEWSGVVMSRRKGRRDFSPRELALVREAQALITPLVGGPLARFAEPSPADLSPRVREVLRCLLEGDGDKQIAARLGISRHTVNVHTRVIFRHFGVQSRAELLARWVRRGWGATCAWADDGR